MDGSSFNPAVAVARLVWHLAGRSELAAIAFYEPRAQLFSDDDQVLPGSNTGARLLGATDGVDQIAGLISRLRADASTRRAAATVWRPEDAVRDSRDIPCTAGLTCHIRGGQLLTTVSMRSNNALRLLPYNLFEFTMLAELIAAELEVEPGPYWHTVNSLHVFAADFEAANALTQANRGDSPAMAPMPGPGAIEEAACLAEHEARLRAAFEADARSQLKTLVRHAERDLHPYWFGLYSVLALFCARRAKAGDAVDFERLAAATPPALRTELAS
ncbi:MAG TPA: thymidylate synthase [Solirubrobacterales bacterium]